MNTVDSPMPSPGDAPPDGGRRRIRPVSVLLSVVVLLIASMWVYALFFASKEAAYRVDDDAWRERAGQICERYQAERLALVDTAEGYIAEPTQEQMLQRADVVDRATDLLESQLEEILAVPPPTAEDQVLVADFEEYWRTLIADRRAYTERLRNFDLQPYLETKIDGGPVSNLMSDFAVVNEIKACTPPNELGGDT